MGNVNIEMLYKKHLDLPSDEREDNLTFPISECIGHDLEYPVAFAWSNNDCFTCSRLVPGEVKLRYQFCEYLIVRVKGMGYTRKLMEDSALDVRLPEEVKGRTYVVKVECLS